MKKDPVIWVGCVLLFLSGGVLFYLVPNGPPLVTWFNNNQGLAAWVQAIFSVFAIIAAGYLPIWHELVRERKQRRNVRANLHFFALPLRKHLEQMKKALAESDWVARWSDSDGPRELKVMGQALNEIPASMMVGFEINLLADIRLAHIHAIEIDKLFLASDADFSSMMSGDVSYFDDCRRMISSLDLVIETLDSYSR